MAVGDVASAISVVTNGSTYDIRPASGVEWVIHNVYYNNSIEFYRTDGTNTIKFDSDTGAGARLGACFRLNNGNYLQVKNVSGATATFAYDGMQTK